MLIHIAVQRDNELLPLFGELLLSSLTLQHAGLLFIHPRITLRRRDGLIAALDQPSTSIGRPAWPEKDRPYLNFSSGGILSN